MPTPEPVLNGTKNFSPTDVKYNNAEHLKRTLPHLDQETGLKNRVVKRDPITGYGVVATGTKEEKSHPRALSTGRKAYNRTLITWDADTPNGVGQVNNAKQNNEPPRRNPIALIGELGTEFDSLRSTGRPRTGEPREPQRDPISGRGNFGVREWDPIGKYNGRTRRAKSSTSIRCNPLTGENVKTFNIMIEEKKYESDAHNQHCVSSPRNIFTGENCDSYTVSPELKSPKKKPASDNTASGRNVITGTNCNTYDFNSEVHTSRKRAPCKVSNPVSGENVSTYNVSNEERPRTSKPYVYRNTVTGENVPSYKITPIERNITPRALKEKQNPVNGENVQTYTYRVGEGKPAVKKRDLSSPLTGEGSSCRTYTISVEERQPHQQSSNNYSSNVGARVRARSSGPLRNVLTGENCETFMVSREMRSEKLSNGLIKPSYNILTGALM